MEADVLSHEGLIDILKRAIADLEDDLARYKSALATMEGSDPFSPSPTVTKPKDKPVKLLHKIACALQDEQGPLTCKEITKVLGAPGASVGGALRRGAQMGVFKNLGKDTGYAFVPGSLSRVGEE